MPQYKNSQGMLFYYKCTVCLILSLKEYCVNTELHDFMTALI